MGDDECIDANKILTALDNENNEQFMNLTKQSIQKQKNNILQQLQLEPNVIREMHQKLKRYRYVCDLSDLKYGAYIRWINISKSQQSFKLTNGGIVIDINIYNDGVQIRCRNSSFRYFNLKFDECLIFQKLTDQEETILAVIDALGQL